MTGDCGPATWKILRVSGTELDSGEGRRERDWRINGEHSLLLRAEALGRGRGRVYTITIEATDASGKSSFGTTTVIVPHDPHRVSTGKRATDKISAQPASSGRLTQTFSSKSSQSVISRLLLVANAVRTFLVFPLSCECQCGSTQLHPAFSNVRRIASSRLRQSRSGPVESPQSAREVVACSTQSLGHRPKSFLSRPLRRRGSLRAKGLRTKLRYRNQPLVFAQSSIKHFGSKPGAQTNRILSLVFAI